VQPGTIARLAVALAFAAASAAPAAPAASAMVTAPAAPVGPTLKGRAVWAHPRDAGTRNDLRSIYLGSVSRDRMPDAAGRGPAIGYRLRGQHGRST